MPIIFAETRKLAQEWTYRFLAASLHEVGLATGTGQSLGELGGAPAPEPKPPKPAVVRAWARQQGHDVADKGRIRPELVEAYLAARRTDSS